MTGRRSERALVALALVLALVLMLVLDRATALSTMKTAQPLAGRVAVVTGGSRGIGKGIALELGAAGATVVVTGRSTRKGGATNERPLGEFLTDPTIDETCEAITNGPGCGRGVAVACDAGDEADIAKLFEQVQAEHGRLDILVCNAFSTPPKLNDAGFRDSFWLQGAAMWDACINVGLRGAYLHACAGIPLMIDTAVQEPAARPLVVLISSFGGKSYTFNVAYGVGKAGTDRLASDMHCQLSKHGVDTVALYPGLVRTEGNLEMDRRGEWAAASGGLDLNSDAESPRFTGRAVCALATAPDVMQARSGSVQVVAELGKELGFTDVDGAQPPSIRSLKFILPNFVFPDIEAQFRGPLPAWLTENVPDFLLPWSVFGAGPPPERPAPTPVE